MMLDIAEHAIRHICHLATILINYLIILFIRRLHQFLVSHLKHFS